VPLYFLQHNAARGGLALGLAFFQRSPIARFGACVKRACVSSRRPVSFIASGDLSPPFQAGSAGGLYPKATCSTKKFIAALQGNRHG